MAVESASVSLTTADKVRTYLGLGSSVLPDATLTPLIAVVSALIEQHCNRKFNQASVTEYHDGEGCPYILVNRPPIASTPAPVVYDDTGRDFESGSLVDSDDYAIDYDEGRIELDSGNFADGNQNVKVTYTGGYATIPDAVEQAANILVAAMYHRGKEGGDGINGESLGGHNIVWQPGDDFPPFVVKLLDGVWSPAV